MDDIKEKMRLVYFPFLLTAACFIGLYTLLNWLLIVELHVIDLDEGAANIWIPIILPWIPCLIWLWPRLKKLEYASGNRGALGFLFIAAFTISFSTVFAQKYLATATGKLTTLQYINEIQVYPSVKYYELKKGYIGKTNMGVAYAKQISGKYRQRLNISVYAVLPVYRAPTDTIQKECSFWLAKKYTKTINNWLPAEKKERLFQTFLTEAKRNIVSVDFDSFTFLERIGHRVDRKIFNDAVTKSGLVTYQDPVFLEIHSELFSKRNGNAFIWIFASFGIGASFVFLLLLTPKVSVPTAA